MWQVASMHVFRKIAVNSFHFYVWPMLAATIHAWIPIATRSAAILSDSASWILNICCFQLLSHASFQTPPATSPKTTSFLKVSKYLRNAVVRHSFQASTFCAIKGRNCGVQVNCRSSLQAVSENHGWRRGGTPRDLIYCQQIFKIEFFHGILGFKLSSFRRRLLKTGNGKPWLLLFDCWLDNWEYMGLDMTLCFKNLSGDISFRIATTGDIGVDLYLFCSPTAKLAT